MFEFFVAAVVLTLFPGIRRVLMGLIALPIVLVVGLFSFLFGNNVVIEEKK